jgi:hypothetical protein
MLSDRDKEDEGFPVSAPLKNDFYGDGGMRKRLIDSAQTSTSFPFLAIAHRYGVPYGRVIRMVQELQDAHSNHVKQAVIIAVAQTDGQLGRMARDIIDAVVGEDIRRNNPPWPKGPL